MSDLVHAPRHIVAATALIRNAAGDILMIDSPKRGWDTPGGQVEEGESLLEGLQREILEETGVHAIIDTLALVHSNIERVIVIFGFIGRYESGTLTPSPESLSVEWLPAQNALQRITHPVVRDRTRQLLEFEGRVIYHCYQYPEYHVLDTRFL